MFGIPDIPIICSYCPEHLFLLSRLLVPDIPKGVPDIPKGVPDIPKGVPDIPTAFLISRFAACRVGRSP
jgi:hypothetical protein